MFIFSNHQLGIRIHGHRELKRPIAVQASGSLEWVKAVWRLELLNAIRLPIHPLHYRTQMQIKPALEKKNTAVYSISSKRLPPSGNQRGLLILAQDVYLTSLYFKWFVRQETDVQNILSRNYSKAESLSIRLSLAGWYRDIYL